MKTCLVILTILSLNYCNSQLLKGSNYFSFNSIIGEYRTEANYIKQNKFEKPVNIDTNGAVKTSSNSNGKIIGAFGYHFMLNQKWQLNLKSHLVSNASSKYKRYDIGIGVRYYFSFDSMSLYRQFYVEANGFNGNLEFGTVNNFYNQIGLLGGLTWRVGVNPFTDFNKVDKSERIVGRFGVDLQFGVSSRFSKLYTKPEFIPVINLGICFYFDKKHWFKPGGLDHHGLEKSFAKRKISQDEYGVKRRERDKQIRLQQQSLAR